MSMLYTLYQNPILLWSIIAVILLWELLWKGLALWKATKQNHKIWFILILVLNTLGILPIIYLVVSCSKKENHNVEIVDIEKPQKRKSSKEQFPEELVA